GRRNKDQQQGKKCQITHRRKSIMADKTKNRKKKSPIKSATIGIWITSAFFIKKVLPIILISILFAVLFVVRSYMMRDVMTAVKQTNKDKEFRMRELQKSMDAVNKFTQSQEAIANQLITQGIKINEGEKFVLYKDN
ncbi:MAG: hypothetical protein LBC89_06345, partial [Bacteroidales bacterium]|nr:hypothetical protein [Bacteroidales bacterium]